MTRPTLESSRNEMELRGTLVEVGRRLYEAGLLQADNGNLSARMADGRIVITPSGACKGRLTPDELILLDPGGRPVREGGRSSSELPMHLEAYRRRPDIGAVVHAHPPCATALTLAGIPFPSDILFEGVLALGDVPTAALTMPSCQDGAGAITDLIVDHNAILLPHHGCVVVGRHCEDAALTLERLEHIARIFAWGELLGGAHRLPAPIVRALQASRSTRSE